MTSKMLRSAFLRALVGLCVFNGGVSAQRAFSPRDIGGITDAVIQQLLPPNQLLSRVSVAQRTLFFDRARTMRAFGYGAAADSLEVALHSKVRPGTQSLLADCGPAPGGEKPCARLGQAAYLWIEPVSLTGPEIVVRAHVLWPDRGSPLSRERASLVGFSGDVYLARSASGGWRFVRRGKTAVS